MNSCGNACGPSPSVCGGQCRSSNCGANDCVVGCEVYCLHNSCGFNCGGDNTIKTSPNPSNCPGLCSSSSCSATGRGYNHYTEFSFYTIYVYILYI